MELSQILPFHAVRFPLGIQRVRVLSEQLPFGTVSKLYKSVVLLSGILKGILKGVPKRN